MPHRPPPPQRCLEPIRALVMTTVLAVAAASPADAQVNTERLRGGEEREGWSGSVGFDLSARTGNVVLIQTGLQTRWDHVGRTATVFVVGRTDLGWNSERRYLSENLVHLRTVLRRAAALRPEAFVQVNNNAARLLTLRWIAGAGLRTRLRHDAATQVWWGTAYLFEHEQLDLPAGAVHPPTSSSHRWSNYVSARIGLTDRATLIGTVYVQPRFDDLEDTRALGEFSLGAQMSETVSLVASANLHYDSRPPDGKQALDTIIKTGIAVAF